MEPITISAIVLGTTFMNEGIKFLWKQANTIVDRYHERKYKKIDEAEAKKVETTDTPEFLQLPPTLEIDFDKAKEKASKLAILSEELEPYLNNEKQPDENLKSTMNTLQKLIEDVYHYQFTKESFSENVIRAAAGGKIEADEVDQKIQGKGKNIMESGGEGSEIKIGKTTQKITE